jgi:Na+/proline symporter
LCEYVGTTVLQISLSIFGILGGPLLGVISLGMFVPFANSCGAMSGFLVSVVVNIWLSLSTILYGKKPKPKPFSQENCINLPNITNNISKFDSLLINNTTKTSTSSVLDYTFEYFL